MREDRRFKRKDAKRTKDAKVLLVLQQEAERYNITHHVSRFKKTMSKRIIFLLIGVLISVVSLYLAFKDFDLGQVWDAIGRVRLEFFLIMVVPYMLTFMTKVWRWRVMFN